MRSALATWALLLGPVFAVAAHPERRALSGLGPMQREAVIEWLARDCGVAEASDVHSRAEAEDAVAAAFWEAYRLGPIAEEIEAWRAWHSQRIAARRRWLLGPGNRVLGPEGAGAALALLDRASSEEALARQVRRYRSAALAGVGRFGSSDWQQALETAAADPDEVLGSAAREALGALRRAKR